MHDLAQDPNNLQIVNALDIPMGDVSVTVPPQYRQAEDYEAILKLD
jgi:hypothetical protein